jgi:hypothetical protein
MVAQLKTLSGCRGSPDAEATRQRDTIVFRERDVVLRLGRLGVLVYYRYY